MSVGTRNLAFEHLHRNPAEAVRVLDRHPPASVAEVLAEAPPETSAGVLVLLPPLEAAACLKRLPVATRHQVLQACSAPASAALLRVLPETSRKSMLEGVADRERKQIERALRLPPESAGAAADPRACILYDDMPVEQAIHRLREGRAAVESTLIVISRHRRVQGAVTLGQLLVAPRDRTVGSLQLAKARTVSQGVSLSALVSDERNRAEPVAVLDPTGRVAGVLSEGALRASAQPRAPQRAAHLASAVCELYWCGIGRLLGEAIAIQSVAPQASGGSRAEIFH